MKKNETLIKQDPLVFPHETSHLRLIGEANISATKAGKGIEGYNSHPFHRVNVYYCENIPQTVSIDTVPAKALVYEQIENGNYTDFFGSFHIDFDLLEFKTHEQIKYFVENSPGLLHQKGYGTHFLYKNEEGEYFVARVASNPDGSDLNVAFVRLTLCRNLRAEDAHRIVILVKKMEPKN